MEDQLLFGDMHALLPHTRGRGGERLECKPHLAHRRKMLFFAASV
jgi:hypothetical protein